jgi:hypothetical protein
MRTQSARRLFDRTNMKKLIASFCLAITLIVSPISFSGCKQLPSLSAQSSDQIILRAEQTAQTARLTFDTFVHLERQNEALLKQVNPKIHEYANTVRRNGLNWVTSLRNATKAFKANRTPENQASLNTWLATLTNATTETNRYIAQSKQAVTNP